MIKLFAAAGVVAMASNGYAGPGAVTPALAACSKALIETLAKSETLPVYKVKPASAFVSDLVDPHSFTVYARNAKTQKLLAKASCRATPKGEVLTFKALPSRFARCR
jgi:hypothetical protein